MDRSEARAPTSDQPFDDQFPHRSFPARGVRTRLTPRPFEQDTLAKRNTARALLDFVGESPSNCASDSCHWQARFGHVPLFTVEILLRDRFGRVVERRLRREPATPATARRLTRRDRRRGGSVGSVAEGPPNRRCPHRIECLTRTGSRGARRSPSLPKEKFWYRPTSGQDHYSGNWLFKYPQQETGQHCAEKIAAEMAELLEIPHATERLAKFEDARGSVTESFVQSGSVSVHGNQLLARTADGREISIAP